MLAHGASRGTSPAVSDQPGGRHVVGQTFIEEVSPSGLMRLLRHPTHGSRRGLRSGALRAEELSSAFGSGTAK